MSKQSSAPISDFLRAALMRFKRSWRRRSRLTRSAQSTPIRPKVFNPMTNLQNLMFQSFQLFQKFQLSIPLQRLERLERLELLEQTPIIACCIAASRRPPPPPPSARFDLRAPARTARGHPSR